MLHILVFSLPFANDVCEIQSFRTLRQTGISKVLVDERFTNHCLLFLHGVKSRVSFLTSSRKLETFFPGLISLALRMYQ